MSTEVVRPYRGVSAEERRAERRARLKEGCLDVIGADGVAAVTVDAVCARAGLTKRYFYESFADRDALFAEVIDDFFTDVRAEMLDALTGAGPAAGERAHTIAGTLIEFLERDPRRARLYVEAPGHDVLRRRQEEAFETFTRLVLEHLSGPDPRRSPAGRALAALIVVVGTTHAATTWLRGGLDLDRDRLVDELTDVMLAALRAD